MIEQSQQVQGHDIAASDALADTSPQSAQSRPMQPAAPMPSYRRQSASLLYLPLWSLAFMLLAVIMLAAGIVWALISLRSDAPLPQVEPVIQIVVADPTKLSAASGDDSGGDEGAQAAGDGEVIIAQPAPGDMQMAGPVLPTVEFVPTPVPITVGAGVEVSGVGEQTLNIRNAPSLSQSQILFRVPEGALFDITGGPSEADGFSWWKVRDPEMLVEGWAVGNYLKVMAN